MELHDALEQARYPFIIVGTLPKEDREVVVHFLLELNVPVYLEAVSLIREDPRLQRLRIRNIDNLWEFSEACGYPIDLVVRIGGVPIAKFWRDLEEKKKDVAVFSVTHLPFSGLSRGEWLFTPLNSFFSTFSMEWNFSVAADWQERDLQLSRELCALFMEEPFAEPSVLYALSREIPEGAMVYLGNSLPVREWDFAAVRDQKNFEVYASRGANGIDGQVSTFLGMAQGRRNCWGIFGDLTFLYDMAAPWILGQHPFPELTFFVVNNGGGKIFERLFAEKEFQNTHQLQFEALARFWGIDYFRFEEVGRVLEGKGTRLIECLPDREATSRFWRRYTILKELYVQTTPI